ncbi:MAG: sigma-54-dependent Fis family transcriptional regulator [Halioglobus sp.]|nr:sigma-54-dependent Fis family transcriptional regulator [Halioglobus sp.]
MEKKPKVLMVEDSISLSTLYKAYLEDSHYTLVSVASLGAAHAALDACQPDIVLLDIELPDGNGMDFLTHIAAQDTPAKVVVMTAHGTSDMAVKAMQQGASDFLTKPFDATRLKVTLDNTAAQLELGKRANELAALERDKYFDFVGKSLAMQSVYRTIDSLASSNATGFIVGESGTGKELAAIAIHRQSARSKAEFVAINCGAIPGELMESELFGHVKGAFTGAINEREGAASIANGGTLFLDEICEMSLNLQKKLLRFIQTGTFRKVGSNVSQNGNMRFVCATNRDPLLEVREGRFREDLFYRLYVIPLRMPPLRERESDVLRIAKHFLQKFSAIEGRRFSEFSPDAVRAIQRYPWPGNVRQLQNAMQQVVVLHDATTVEHWMLPDTVTSGNLESGSARANNITPLNRHGKTSDNMAHTVRREQVEPLWLTEKKAVESAISACEGNINQAAGLLEVAPSTLYRKLQSWKKISTL